MEAVAVQTLVAFHAASHAALGAFGGQRRVQQGRMRRAGGRQVAPAVTVQDI